LPLDKAGFAEAPASRAQQSAMPVIGLIDSTARNRFGYTSGAAIQPPRRAA